MDIKQLIGSNMQRARVEKGLSLGELAKRTSLTEGTLLDIELGNLDAEITVLWQIATTLDVPLSALCQEDATATALKMETVISEEQLVDALLTALEEYSEETIIDILETEEGGWANGAEALNYADIAVVKGLLEALPYHYYEINFRETDTTEEWAFYVQTRRPLSYKEIVQLLETRYLGVDGLEREHLKAIASIESISKEEYNVSSGTTV